MRDPAEAVTGQPYSYANDNPVTLADPTGLVGEAAAAGAGCTAGEIVDPIGGCAPGAVVGVGIDEIGNAAEGLISLFASSNNDTSSQSNTNADTQSQSPDCTGLAENPFATGGLGNTNPVRGASRESGKCRHAGRGFLDRLLGMEADDIVLLIRITRERASRRQIRGCLPQKQTSDLEFLRCRQERGPHATRARPWSLGRPHAAELAHDQ